MQQLGNYKKGKGKQSYGDTFGCNSNLGNNPDAFTISTEI
jgi:hypothetical protein